MLMHLCYCIDSICWCICHDSPWLIHLWSYYCFFWCICRAPLCWCIGYSYYSKCCICWCVCTATLLGVILLSFPLHAPFQSQRYIWLLSRSKDNTQTQNHYKGKYQFQQTLSEPSNTQNNIFWWFFFCIINSVKSEPIRNLFTSLRRLFFPNNLSANTSKIDFPTRIYHPSPLEYIFLIQGTPIQSSLTLNKQHLPRPTIEKVEKWGLFMRSEVVSDLCFGCFR